MAITTLKGKDRVWPVWKFDRLIIDYLKVLFGMDHVTQYTREKQALDSTKMDYCILVYDTIELFKSRDAAIRSSEPWQYAETLVVLADGTVCQLISDDSISGWLAPTHVKNPLLFRILLERLLREGDKLPANYDELRDEELLSIAKPLASEY